MALETKKTHLGLDGRWDLEELSDTTKDYIQLYGFAYSLLPDLPVARKEEIDYIYGKFPWRGGYSTVNFFNQLFHKIPPKLRPEVQRIQYASPGFIELTELLVVSGTVAAIIFTVCKSLKSVHVFIEAFRRRQSTTSCRRSTLPRKISTSNNVRSRSAKPPREVWQKP